MKIFWFNQYIIESILLQGNYESICNHIQLNKWFFHQKGVFLEGRWWQAASAEP